MLRLPSFQYFQPKDVRAAANILAQEGPKATVVAGGTDLWAKMKRRQMEPEMVVGLRHLEELRRFEVTADQELILGANLTLHELERHPHLLEHYPALASAAHSISSPPLKTVGTLGGNLCVDTRCNYYDQTYEWRKSIDFCMKKDGEICWVAPGSPRCWAVSSTDLAPVMLALGAQIHLVSGRSERMLDANDFYQHDGIDYLNKRHDEIVTDVRLPAVHGDLMIFKKLRRRGSIDFPILNVAVWIRPDPSRRVCEDVRIAIGAVTSRPLLAEEARQALLGKPLLPETIEAAAQEAYRVCKPMDNTDLHFSWRHKMVPIWVGRALEELKAKF